MGGPEIAKKLSMQNESMRKLGSVAYKKDVERVGLEEQNYGFG